MNRAHLPSAPRSLAIVMLAAGLTGALLAGCGRVTHLTTEDTLPGGHPSRKTPFQEDTLPGSVFSADDSVCRWSKTTYGGGGGGEEYIKPAATASDAIIGTLEGDSPAFSPDGTLVATVDGENVRIWRSDDGGETDSLDGDAFVFNPDGHTIALRQADGWQLWDLDAQKGLFQLPDRDASLYFSADGKTIVTEAALSEVPDDTGETVQAGSVTLYSAATGLEQITVSGVAFPTAITSDGSLLATGVVKESGAFDIEGIGIWDAATGEQLHEMQAEIQSQIPLAGLRGHLKLTSLAFSPDGTALLSAGPDAVRLWDTTTGKHLRCFQTPEHLGAMQALWGPQAETIIGTVAAPSYPFVYKKDIYIWDAISNNPDAMLELDDQDATQPVALAGDPAAETAGGTLLAWSGFNLDGTGDRSAYLWDPASQELVGVLPTGGNLAGAALSPMGDRAVTVSVYQDNSAEDGAPAHETLLWDTQQDAVSVVAAAETKFWDALEAAVTGKPQSSQQRLLRAARSLSPELFGEVTQLSETQKAKYWWYLTRQEEVKTLADTSAPAAEAFAAEIRNDTPAWTEWSRAQLIAQLQLYIPSWAHDDPAGLLAAYTEFAKLDPDTARTPMVLGALFDVIAPEAAASAREGAVDDAAAAIEEALAAFLAVDLQSELVAKSIYAQTLVDDGRSAASAGDISGATAKFADALALDPALGLDPEGEANKVYAQALADEGAGAAADGDIATGVAKYGEALALDSSQGAAPPAYVQVYCALDAEVQGGLAVGDAGADVCAGLEMKPETIAFGAPVTGTLAADVTYHTRATPAVADHAAELWSFDAKEGDTVTIQVVGDAFDFYANVELYGPDGSIVPSSTDAANGTMRLDAALPQTGRYLIVVSANYGRGAYWLALSEGAEG